MSTLLATVSSLRTWLRPAALLATLALIGGNNSSLQAAAGDSVISGNVSNAATGNLLEGARVEVPQLGVSTLTDRSGHFTLPNIAPGTHELVVSYTGLDPMRAVV